LQAGNARLANGFAGTGKFPHDAGRQPGVGLHVNCGSASLAQIHLPELSGQRRCGCRANRSAEDSTRAGNEECVVTKEDKDWLENASYSDLLRRWRFAPTSDPLVQDDAGIYFQQVLDRRRKEIGVDEHIRISKMIGFRNGTALRN
jgi:hypothetical protein